MIIPQQLEAFRKFAEDISVKAGEILLSYHDKIRILEYKDRQDVSTNADLASENFIIEEVFKQYPDHGVLSEERGMIKSRSEFTWVIDPLDGTKEYIRGLPLYDVAIGLECEKEIIASAIYRPAEKYLYSAAKGMGAYLNGNKIHVSLATDIKDAFVYAYLPSCDTDKGICEMQWGKLIKIDMAAYRLRSYADVNTALCWLAQGGCEAFVNISDPTQWHDVAPGMLIAKEAGALVKDINSNDLPYMNVQTIVAANNQTIFNTILDLTRS